MPRCCLIQNIRNVCSRNGTHIVGYLPYRTVSVIIIITYIYCTILLGLANLKLLHSSVFYWSIHQVSEVPLSQYCRMEMRFTTSSELTVSGHRQKSCLSIGPGTTTPVCSSGNVSRGSSWLSSVSLSVTSPGWTPSVRHSWSTLQVDSRSKDIGLALN